jgi:hypothetical protein
VLCCETVVRGVKLLQLWNYLYLQLLTTYIYIQYEGSMAQWHYHVGGFGEWGVVYFYIPIDGAR